MPFSIVRGDIACVEADVVVNAANERLAPGSGVCGAIYAGAGYDDMLAACRELGGCPTGEAVVTPGFALPARWCVHTVGPVWRGGASGEERALRSCYRSVFREVVRLGAASVAYPLISAGVYGYPAEGALAVAREETRAFLEAHDDVDVMLVVFDDDVIWRGSELAREVRLLAFGDHAVAGMDLEIDALVLEEVVAASPSAARARRPRVPPSLDERLASLDPTFSETVLALVDERGMTDAEVYHRANLSRQLFSKLRGNPGYRPAKATAVALCMGLGLDLGEAEDLLARAGYALSPSSAFDVVVTFFLERGIHDVLRLNEVLFAYDLPLVGSV